MKKRIVLMLGFCLGVFFLAHNLVSYHSESGYIYSLHVKYAQIISSQWRFPTIEETAKFYDPPLFFLISGLFTRLTSQISGQDFVNAITYWRYFSIIFPILSFYLWYQIIKKLLPQKPIPLVFMLILFSLPVLHKTLVMYTIEPWLWLTTSLTLWYFIFKFQPRPTIKHVVVLAGLTVICLLTRISAIALLVAMAVGILGLAYIRQIKFSRAIQLLTIFLTIAFIGSGWFYGRKSDLYSDRITIIMNRQKDAGLPADQRLAFLTELYPRIILTYPIRREVWLNRFIPIYYSEFWGDFWNFYIQRRFNISFEAREADRLITTPKRVANLAFQNQVNLPSTLLMIFGFIYLLFRLVKNVRRQPGERWLIELMLLITFLVTWIGFLYSITFHGAAKGDSIKASYMLFILPIYVYMLVIFCLQIFKKIKIFILPLILWLALATVINLWWSWY